MSLVDNANKVSYASTFETDKICGIIVGSYDASTYDTVLGGYLYQKKIPHNFTRPVFCDALFSNDNINFTPNGQTLADQSTTLNIYSDSSFIYILNTHNAGAVYYKIVCTWIDDYDTTNPLIAPVLSATSTSAKTYFDTRTNYQKLLVNKPYPLTNPGTGMTGTQDIVHSLDYAPNYKVFMESLPGQVWPSISGGTQDIWLYDSAHQYELYGLMNNLKLTLTFNGGNASAATFRSWVKIYYDGEISA